nr:integrase, catalytic region, zinc finger, CCHC-type, peptidase aspartic, catalytic [Tanacetum cinerariifolium]
KHHYKQLYDSIKITRAKHNKQVTKPTAENVTLKTSVSKAKVQPSVITRTKHAVDVELIVPRLRNNRDAHLDYLRHLKESVETIRDIVEEAKVVVQIVLWYLNSGCSKHMTGDRSRLLNFMKKFIGIVRFGNDHFGAIMGYGDYVVGESVISRGSRGSNLYTIWVEDMMKSSPICLLSKASKNKSWLWHWRLNHLNFSTINDLARKDLVRGLPRLKFEKGHLCSACQLGKSKKHTHKPKAKNTNLEVLNTLHIILCGPMRPAPNFLTPGQISSIVPNLVPATPYATPTNKELEILFQPMFDEYMDPPRADRPGSPAQAVQPPVTSAGTPLSTTIDQDAPSPRISPSSSALQSNSLPPGVASVLSKIEPKNFKSAIIKDCWFQAMQDEIHEFDRL